MTRLSPPESDTFMELQNEADCDLHMFHSHCFGFSVPEAGIGMYMYLRSLPAYRQSQGGVCIYQGFGNIHPLDMEFQDYEMYMPWPEISGNTIVAANGMRMDFVEPGKTVRLSYSSSDGATSFDVLQQAVTPLVARGDGVQSEPTSAGAVPRSGGSSQILHCTGELILHGQRYEVDCHAFKHRSWGQVRGQIRAERQGAVDSPPIAWTPMYFGPDLAFSQEGFESLDTDPDWKGLFDISPDRPAHHVGWVWHEGVVRALTSVRRNVLQRDPVCHVAIKQEIEADDDAGHTHRFFGEAIALAPIPAWPNLACFDSVYRWQDERGRVTYCSYLELWWDKYQRSARQRAANLGGSESGALAR